MPKPPPWAYPLWTAQEVYRHSTDRMSVSTAQAIDQAMTHKAETKKKFVKLSLLLEKQALNKAKDAEVPISESGYSSSLEVAATSNVCCTEEDTKLTSRVDHNSDLEWVRVVLAADPGVRMDDIEDQGPPRRREHRRVPSTVAIAEVQVSLSMVDISILLMRLSYLNYLI